MERLLRDFEDSENGAFDRVRDILNGGPRIALDPVSSKMLRGILGGMGIRGGTPIFGSTREDAPRDAFVTQTEITRETFIVHFGPRKRQRPSTYGRSLAVPIVSELMTRVALNKVTGPIVGCLPSARVSEATGEFGSLAYPAWSYGPRLLWVVPGEDVLKLVVRTNSEPPRECPIQEIPLDGPLAIPPEVLPWVPDPLVPVVFVEFDAPKGCPRCEEYASRYREVEDALVCLSCGRSFKRGLERS